MVTLTASFLFLYSFIQLNIFNAIDQALMQSFQLDALELGELGSLFFYANALFLLPAGMLIDRFSSKKIIMAAVFVLTLGTFLFAIATNYYVAAIGRFLTGGASAFAFLSCIRLASRWFPPHKMAFVSGILVTMAMIGGLIAQTPMAMLTEVIDWRQAMLLDAALGVMMLAAIFFIVQDYPAHSNDQKQKDQAHLRNMGVWQSLKLVIFNAQNWLGGLYTAFLNLPVFLLGAIWGIHYLTEVHHLSVLEASYATTMFFVGVIVGAPFFGWLSDTMGRRVVPMILGAIASLIVIFAIIYMPHLTLTECIALFFLIGFVTSSQVLTYPAVAELNPAILTSSAISIVSFTIMASGVIFQPLFGWLMELGWDHTIINGVPVYSSTNLLHAMLIMPVAFIAGFFVTFLMKETYCKSEV
jgi:MFS family permease